LNVQVTVWALGFFDVGHFIVGQFAVKKEIRTKPNLIWPNLTETTNFFFYGEMSHGKNPATHSFIGEFVVFSVPATHSTP